MLLAEPNGVDFVEEYVQAEVPAIKGRVIRPDSEAYDGARQLWHLNYQRRPGVIFEPVDAADVAVAVRYARDNDLPLSVRSGGHSVAGHSMNDGGVVISLQGMKRVDVDAAKKTARVQAGATAGEILNETQKFGLVLPMGDARSVGVGGLTLGGGIGWLSRKYGLTIDHLLEVELVTADGEIITASDDEHADLFWAVRGGGGNFGVVTTFTFKLREVSVVTGGALIIPATPDNLVRYAQVASEAPDELTTIAYMAPAPPLPFIPENWVGKLIVIISMVHCGSLTDGEQAVAPFRAIAEPVADLVGPMPYGGMYDLTDPMTQPQHSHLRAMYTHALTRELAEQTIERMNVATSPHTHVQFRVFGGEVARKDPSATAFAHRDKQVLVAAIIGYMDPSESDMHKAWCEETWDAIKEEADGVYSNFLGDEGRGRIHAAYPGSTYCRLAQVKQQYDPENVFRMNQNIKPNACK